MNILLGILAMVTCLVIQGLLILFTVRYYVQAVNRHANNSLGFGLLVINGIMIVQVIGIIAQILVWAVLFMMLGEFSDFFVAAYHSGVNFATLGYGDIVMSDAHRALGPLEAVSGAMMIGSTTAIMMSVIQDMLKRAWPDDTPS
ncbi:MAG: ion channel [Pseudomonadales bacterium]